MLLAAVRGAARGQAVLDPAITGPVRAEWPLAPGPYQAPRIGSVASGPHPLTERELAVLRLLAQGRTNRQISQTLFVSEETAKSHVANILAKLDLNHRNQTIVYALKHGLVSLEDLQP